MVPGERRAAEGVVLGLRETRCCRCLAGRRCLGSGRGRAPGPCRESSEEDEEERERERTPVMKMTQRNERQEMQEAANSKQKPYKTSDQKHTTKSIYVKTATLPAVYYTSF